MVSKSQGTKVSPKRSNKMLTPNKVQVSGKCRVSRSGEEAKPVEAAARLAIELHREALKELERY